MSNTVPSLQIGMPYTGTVIKVENAAVTLKANAAGTVTFVHKLLICFDDFPEQHIECQFCDEIIDSKVFKPGEHVKIFPKNFKYNNYTVRKDETYVSPQYIPKETIEAAEFHYVKGEIPSALVSGDLKASFIQTAVMAAATFTQYRPEIGKDEFYSIAHELINLMGLKYEK